MSPQRLPVFRSAVLACAALAFAPFAAHAQSSMQGVPNAMQGFSQNRDKPVQIDAGSLEVRDKDKAATFSGDVKVVQGDTTMRSKSLVVFYDGSASPTGKQAAPKQPAKEPTMKSATPGPAGSSSIRRLEARGGVTVTQKDQTVTGDTGIFDMKSNSITMSGANGVVLTQADNVIRADRLMVDMTTGVSRLECDKGRSCVSALINTNNKGAPGGGGPAGLLPSQPKSSAPAPSTPPARSREPMQLSPR